MHSGLLQPFGAPCAAGHSLPLLLNISALHTMILMHPGSLLSAGAPCTARHSLIPSVQHIMHVYFIVLSPDLPRRAWMVLRRSAAQQTPLRGTPWKGVANSVPVRAGSFVNEVHFSGQSPHAIVNQCNYTNVTSRYNKNCLFDWMVFRSGTNQLLRL